jgi:outer membrane protein W
VNKCIFILGLAVFSLLIGIGLAGADELPNRFGAGGGIRFYFVQEDAVDDNIAFGANVSYLIMPHFSTELELDYFKTDVEDAGIELGEVTAIPLMLSGQFRILTEGPVIPYVGAGVAYLINKFDTGPEPEDELETLIEQEFGGAFNVDVDIEVDDSWGWLLNGGFDWFLTDKVALNIDTKYLWSEADVNIDVSGSGKSQGMDFIVAWDERKDIELDSWIVGAGIKFYF